MPLAEPDANLSAHPAPIKQTLRSYRCPSVRRETYVPWQPLEKLARPDLMVFNWLQSTKLSITDLNERLLEAFPKRKHRESRGDLRTLQQFLDHLRRKNVVPARNLPCDISPLGHILNRYETHLPTERGLVAHTIQEYQSFARKFLKERFRGRPLRLKAVKASNISDFILRHTPSMAARRAQTMTSAFRSFFRLLFQKGELQADLSCSVPTVANWRLSTVPKYLPPHGLHSLRHTLATRLLEKGTPFTTIAEILGHSSLESTLIYAKADVDADSERAPNPSSRCKCRCKENPVRQQKSIRYLGLLGLIWLADSRSRAAAPQARIYTRETNQPPALVPAYEKLLGKLPPGIKAPAVPTELYLSPNGRRFAAIGKADKEKWIVVLDGVVRPSFEEVATPVFSPGEHLAYKAMRDPHKYVTVVDGKAGNFRDILSTFVAVQITQRKKPIVRYAGRV